MPHVPNEIFARSCLNAAHTTVTLASQIQWSNKHSSLKQSSSKIEICSRLFSFFFRSTPRVRSEQRQQSTKQMPFFESMQMSFELSYNNVRRLSLSVCSIGWWKILDNSGLSTCGVRVCASWSWLCELQVAGRICRWKFPWNFLDA